MLHSNKSYRKQFKFNDTGAFNIIDIGLKTAIQSGFTQRAAVKQ
jgi:hypothetical protein